MLPRVKLMLARVMSKMTNERLQLVKRFSTLNALSMYVNETSDDTRVPAGKFVEYMDQTSIVHRQLPAITSSVQAIERYLKNLDK